MSGAQVFGVAGPGGEVLERHHGVERRARPGEPLDVRETEVLVVHQRRPLRLYVHQEVSDALRRVQPYTHRDRVDEQPQHVLHARQLRRAAA